MLANEQEVFWAKTYSKDYIEKNNSFHQALGMQAWEIMLSRAENVTNILECGCNIGRNIPFLNSVLPKAHKSIIEISPTAYEHVVAQYALREHFNGSILESSFRPRSFDLVFTTGVLIHIHPDNLLANMGKMYEYSNRYILMSEYFNRIPVMIDYQGQKNKLFKRDFGKLFIENYPVKLVDYGFLWGHIYDSAGFDDQTWWLFEK